MGIKDIVETPNHKVSTFQAIKNSDTGMLKVTGIRNEYWREHGGKDDLGCTNFNQYQLIGKLIGGGTVEFSAQNGEVESYAVNQKKAVLHVSPEFLKDLNKMKAKVINMTEDFKYSVSILGLDKDHHLYGSYRLTQLPGRAELDMDIVGTAGLPENLDDIREADEINGQRQAAWQADRLANLGGRAASTANASAGAEVF